MLIAQCLRCNSCTVMDPLVCKNRSLYWLTLRFKVWTILHPDQKCFFSSFFSRFFFKSGPKLFLKKIGPNRPNPADPRLNSGPGLTDLNQKEVPSRKSDLFRICGFQPQWSHCGTLVPMRKHACLPSRLKVKGNRSPTWGRPEVGQHQLSGLVSMNEPQLPIL
jgi:hypothetical protein